MPERDQKAAEIDRLAADTAEKLRGRLAGLRLELHGGGVILRGTAQSFYAKQLAQHAVMSGTDLPIVRNEIEVTCSAGRPAGVIGYEPRAIEYADAGPTRLETSRRGPVGHGVVQDTPCGR